MNFLTTNRICIIIAFIVLSFIMLTYSKNMNRVPNSREGFNQSEICDSYLKEAIHRYPCSSPRVKRHFLDWCNSFRRRHGMFPDLPDSFTMFHRLREEYNTYDSL